MSQLEEKIYKKNGLLHREDGPALILADGTKYWYNEGKLHRLDGPAIESDIFREWFQYGYLHRIGGPAIEKSYIGNRIVKNLWYLRGERINSAQDYWDLLTEEEKIKCIMSEDFFNNQKEKE